MAYHRGGHAGAVAVSYSTSAMPTSMSPNRRFSSGSSGTTTSGVGSSSAKLSSYRSSASSSFDRSSYYSSGSTSSSGYGSHRSSYSSSDYRRFSSPARSLSVSSASSFSDAGCSSGSSGIGGSGSGLGINGGTSSGRYSTSSSRDRSESRDIVGSSVTSAADIIAKYSPAKYVPNIIASNERHAAAAAAAAAAASSSSSTLSYNGYGSSPSAGNSTAIFGGNAANANKTSSSSTTLFARDTTSNELSTSDIIQGRPPRATRRSPINTLQINSHATLQPDSGVATEVTRLQLLHLKGDKNDNNNNSNNKNNNNNANENVNNEEKIFYDHGVNDNDNDAASGRINLNANDTYEATGGIFTCRSELNSTLLRNKASVTPSNNSDSVVCINNTVSGFTKISTANNSNLFFTNTEVSNNNLNSNNEEYATVDNVTDEIEVGDLSKADDQISGDTINFGENYLNNQDSINGDVNIVKEKNSGILNNRGDVTPLLFLPSTSNSFFNSLDLTSGGVRSTLRNKGVVSRPSGNQTGDNTNTTLPSTSRRGDTYTGNGSTSNGSSNGLGNTSQSATAHQNIYRGIADQIEGSPTIRAPRNRLQTPRDERCGLNGLRNIGNTCFMNSVIQCLSNTRPLLEYLVNEQYLADINTTTSSMKGALIKAFSQVIQELWEVGGDHVVNTASLKSQIQRFAPRFMGYSQQDAQEFLRYLLEGLHEDVNRVTVKPQPIHTDIPDHYSDSQKAAESWKRYLRNEDSTIVDVFVGQLRSSLHCTSCGHVSVTLDPFWDLSLPIPTRSGTVKLNQCLEHFTREEILDGDEKPTCSKCQMRRKCTKSFSIQKFPKILVIHLKRFSPMERFRGKLNTLVDFPLTGLDLGAFSAPRVAGCTYNLYGVANHSGTTYSGHYTAYCKHPYSGEWHEYNDSRVSMIAARSVVSSEGYVLFYEQQPHSSNL